MDKDLMLIQQSLNTDGQNLNTYIAEPKYYGQSLYTDRAEPTY